MRLKLKDFFDFSIKDTCISLAIMLSAGLLCAPLRSLGGSDFHVPLIFVLGVVLISRLTNGYFYGVISSVISVFCVNYIFTYPYFAFNFTIAGYPLAFISMLAVTLITCTLTTQIKQQEKIRIESEKEKMHANLLRAISHDLRTPLTSIIGSTAVICENFDNMPKEKQLELLADVREEAQWLIRMVENLLSITRISSNAAAIKKRLEAVEEIFSEVVGKFKKQYPDIHVTVSSPDELLLAPMDAILIEQVILNLLTNSASHGKRTTEIRLSAVREGNIALFSVEDNGVGFSEESIPHLFDNYYAHAYGKNPSDGRRSMGIGLSVCMSIVKVHGGEMKASNGPRGGAAVKFKLPLKEN